jgi:hypothetical protein
MTPWGLVNCKVFGLQGPSLTNRVSELFTHGSVGGVGRKPGPYPAGNSRRAFPFPSFDGLHTFFVSSTSVPGGCA